MKRAYGAWILFAACLLCACDAHDYWALPHILQIDTEQDQPYDAEYLNQDLFVRYQLDYEIANQSESTHTEAVVTATSYVNGVVHSAGTKVWHLEQGETEQGILTTSQLQLGNELLVSLSSCAYSRCTRKEILCPKGVDSLPAPAEIASFCYQACEDTSQCAVNCPAEKACAEFCKDTLDYDLCFKHTCSTSGTISTCLHYCKDDEECLETCEVAPECLATCNSQSATCFRNCLATWTQCTDETYKTEEDYPESTKIPCTLCDGALGFCSVSFTHTGQEIHYLYDEEGNPRQCDLNCSTYPPECITGCQALYESSSDRMQCVDACLSQFLFWCNDESIPSDYVNSSGKQPCCFSETSQATLTGVVKTYNVECFNDTECGSGSSCSEEGICVSSGKASCSAMPQNTKPVLPVLLLTLAAFFVALRRKIYR